MPGRPRVLLSVRAPRPTTNPYVVQLAGALDEHVDVLWFSWRAALLGRYDVLHWHWPEVALRRGGAPARVAARLRFAALLARVALTSTPVVRTLHNRAPHEDVGALDALLLRAAAAQTTWWVVLNEDTPAPEPARTTLAPIGHYRDWFGARADLADAGAAPVPGRALHLGLVRPYKGVEELVGAFAGVEDPGASLHVVGSCEDPGLRAALERAAAPDGRVALTLRHVDDDALAGEVAAAEVVALPHRDLHNSSSALLALSLGRPVLVPSTPTTEALAREVGREWVIRYDGDLRAEHLERAAREAGAVLAGGSAPDLSARDWPPVAAAHAGAYAGALAVRRGRVRPGRVRPGRARR